MTLRPSLVLAAAFVLAACGKRDAASGDTSAAAAAAASTPAASSGGDDLADVTNYKLSMDKIDRYIAAQRNITNKVKSMSLAEKQAMEARNEGGDNSNASIDDMTRNID